MSEKLDMTGIAGGRLLFVGGAPRSGTTLLQNMLDSHPEIAAGPEFDLSEKIIELRNLLQLKIANGRIDSYLGKADADRAVAGFIEEMLLPYADRKGCRLLSEKTPANVMIFKELLEIFPAAKMIFCVRDPRAVVSSLMMVRKKAIRRNGRFSIATLARRFWRAAWYTRSCMQAGNGRFACESWEGAAGSLRGDGYRPGRGYPENLSIPGNLLECRHGRTGEDQA